MVREEPKQTPQDSSKQFRFTIAKRLIPITPLNLDEEGTSKQGWKQSMEQRINVNEEKKSEVNEPTQQASGVSYSNPAPQCMEKLREELSCTICLEICFEPSTILWGHSFCKKCFKLAADKCGKKCPKCRQLISNGRSCTVDTVRWNTIQLLFPQEVEARKAAGALNGRKVERQSPEWNS